MEAPALLGYMQILLAALDAELARDGSRDGMCSLALRPGASVSYDFGPESGCHGGMGWVQFITVFPTVTFPSANTDINNCADTLAYSVAMGIIRPDDIPEDYTDDYDARCLKATDRQVRDMKIMHRALKAAREEIPLMIIGTYTPIGMEGGTFGGTWDATIGSEPEDEDD
jgi:hypothetical protein